MSKKVNAGLNINLQSKCSICDAIYIDNTQQTFKKIYSHFPDILFLFKNGQKSDSFAAHFEHHFQATMSHTDLRKYNTFKVVKQIKLIGAMKTITKPNYNLFIEECLTILKKMREKPSQLLTRIWRYMGPAGTNQLFINFS